MKKGRKAIKCFSSQSLYAFRFVCACLLMDLNAAVCVIILKDVLWWSLLKLSYTVTYIYFISGKKHEVRTKIYIDESSIYPMTTRRIATISVIMQSSLWKIFRIQRGRDTLHCTRAEDSKRLIKIHWFEGGKKHHQRIHVSSMFSFFFLYLQRDIATFLPIM